MTQFSALLTQLAARLDTDTTLPAWQAFVDRLTQQHDHLRALLFALYGQRSDFQARFEDILATAAGAWLARHPHLQDLDAERERNPRWFQSNKMLGGIAYVDLFAGNLDGIQAKIPYFKELGLTYLHLMPLFKAPEGNSDGGYAVSSYRVVNPSLGSIDQLRDLAAELHAQGISLCLDFIFNHTSDEYDWAKRAFAGDPHYQAFYHFLSRPEADQYDRTLREIFPDQHPGAFTALAIGSLGNLPVQDLMQRICSAASDRVARRACLLAAIGYLCMGMLPILAGLAANQLLGIVPANGVLTALAQRLLSPALLLVFLLAVVSTVLSTVVSAVLAPAAVLSQNLLQPLALRFGLLQSEPARLGMQRVCAIAIATASVVLALSGSDAYTLVESSYSLSLVGTIAGFAFGLYQQTAPRVAALASMVVGVGLWLLHVIQGWEYFLQPIVDRNSPIEILQILAVIPHELGDTLFSVVAFLILWGVVGLRNRAKA